MRSSIIKNKKFHLGQAGTMHNSRGIVSTMNKIIKENNSKLQLNVRFLN